MPRDNEKIIEIADRLQGQMRDALVEMIQSGVPVGLLREVCGMVEFLERVPTELSGRGCAVGEIRELVHGQLIDTNYDLRSRVDRLEDALTRAESEIKTVSWMVRQDSNSGAMKEA